MLRVLGEVEFVGPDGPVTIGSQLQRSLLAALAFDRGQVVSAARLADRIWGDHPPANPAASLQSHVSRLRRKLPEPVEIVTVGDGYRLDLSDDELDAVRFERRFQQACASDTGDRVPLIDETLALWRGIPYVDIDDPAATAEAGRLGEMRSSLVELRAESLVDAGRPHEAIADLETMRSVHPLRERPVELLMRAYLEAGRKTDSLRVYQELRSWLGDELGLEPSPEVRALEEAILREEVVAERPTGIGPGRSRPSTIAVPTSAFVGRDAELDEVAEVIRAHRIVTVVGAGGVGKTRFAVHAAHRVQDDFDGGAHLIELAEVRDSEHLVEAVASELGVRLQSGVPIIDRIIEHVGDRRMLIVLDNCEHVVDQAADLVHALVVGAETISVVATSREALNIDGERVWRLDPLLTGDEPTDGACQLFAERAAAVLPDFVLDDTTRPAVVDVCRHLDGLPLAIELAAARLATLSLDEVVAGLDERFEVFNRGRRSADERHRSLRAVVEWSCQLLDEAQRQMFERLSVFAGRFTARAADQVCGPAADGLATADVLADLVERSLLGEHRERGAPTRYGYLETIRAYAADRLEERGETAEFSARHAAWAIALAEVMEERLSGPGEIDATRRLSDDLSEFRVAHQYFMAADDAGGALRLAAHLRYFALLRIHSEIHGWIVEAADRFGTVDHPLSEMVLAGASTGAWLSGDHDRSAIYAIASAEAAARRHEPGSGRAAAEARGDRLIWSGDPAGSRDAFLEAVELTREAGDKWGQIFNLANAVMCAGYVGDPAHARELAAEARGLMGDRAAPSLEAWVDYAEGEALAESAPDLALELLGRALELARTSGARFVSGVAGLTHTGLLARRGDPDAFGRVLDLIEHWREGGAWTQQWVTLRTVVDLLVEAGDHEGAGVLLGAIESSRWSATVFGADSERLEKARSAIEATLGGEAEQLSATGAELNDTEAVRHAITRIERLAPGPG